MKVISERLGHASAKMTLDVYTRSLPTLQREAAGRMEDIVAAECKPGAVAKLMLLFKPVPATPVLRTGQNQTSGR